MGRLDPGRGQEASACCCQHLSDHSDTMTFHYHTLWLWGKTIYGTKWFQFTFNFICRVENRHKLRQIQKKIKDSSSFGSASNLFGKYLPEFKRPPFSTGGWRQTWSGFKQLTRPMIRALVHSVGKLNYTGSPLQNDADWNWHLSAKTSCKAERAQVQFD